MIFSFEKKSIDYKKDYDRELYNNLKNMNEKLQSIKFIFENDKEFVIFISFPTYIINKENRLLKVRVNQDFKFLSNELNKNFTKLKFKKFVALQSKYAKNMYILLIPFKDKAQKFFTIKEFKTLLDIPNSYTM